MFSNLNLTTRSLSTFSVSPSRTILASTFSLDCRVGGRAGGRGRGGAGRAAGVRQRQEARAARIHRPLPPPPRQLSTVAGCPRASPAPPPTPAPVAPHLRLARELGGAVAEARNVLLHVGNLLLLPLVLLHLVLLQLRPRAHVRVVVACGGGGGGPGAAGSRGTWGACGEERSGRGRCRERVQTRVCVRVAVRSQAFKLLVFSLVVQRVV